MTTLVNRDDLCVGEDPQRLLGNSRHVAADYKRSLSKIGAKNSTCKREHTESLTEVHFYEPGKMMIHLGDGPQAEVHDVLVVRHPSVPDLQHVRVCVGEKKAISCQENLMDRIRMHFIQEAKQR